MLCTIVKQNFTLTGLCPGQSRCPHNQSAVFGITLHSSCIASQQRAEEVLTHWPERPLKRQLEPLPADSAPSDWGWQDTLVLKLL